MGVWLCDSLPSVGSNVQFIFCLTGNNTRKLSITSRCHCQWTKIIYIRIWKKYILSFLPAQFGKCPTRRSSRNNPSIGTASTFDAEDELSNTCFSTYVYYADDIQKHEVDQIAKFDFMKSTGSLSDIKVIRVLVFPPSSDRYFESKNGTDYNNEVSGRASKAIRVCVLPPREY